MVAPDSYGVLPCSVVLRYFLEEIWIWDTRLSLPMVTYSKMFSYPPFSHIKSPTTPSESEGLDFTAFARRYWRYLMWFLFHTLLRCFSSGGALHGAISTYILTTNLEVWREKWEVGSWSWKFDFLISKFLTSHINLSLHTSYFSLRHK